jgi:serine/threonine protein kinase
LKIIKLGMDTKEVIARFEAERQALAMMDHPGIAKVFDAGSTPSGRPYFVMELVRGESITNFCNGQKLGTRQRLELFVDVCRALQHAHQKGVIHRDIKPSNVLVAYDDDGRPVGKLIDFGIAKATYQPLTDKTLFTRFEQFMGTPTYMSPEQAGIGSLEMDARSDVYSLGVLLYELLAGNPPFDSKTLVEAGYEEMRRIIREDDPPKPSTRLSTLSLEERQAVSGAQGVDPGHLDRYVRGDLDWIVMRAMEKGRSRRYESATAFAQDVQRFLENQPVEAAAPSPIYRLRKLVRRRWVLISTLIVLAAGVLGGVIIGRLGSSPDQAERLLTSSDIQLSLGGFSIEGNQVTIEVEIPENLPEGIDGLFVALVASPSPGRAGADANPGRILFPNTQDSYSWLAAGKVPITISVEDVSSIGRIEAIGNTSEEALEKLLGPAYAQAKGAGGIALADGTRSAIFDDLESRSANDRIDSSGEKALIGYGYLDLVP